MMLRELRQCAGLTQAELGNALNIAPNTISRYETGQRGIDAETAKRIADFFGVSLDDIYGYHPGTDGLFTVRVKGNDMEPRILDGDLITCVKTSAVENGAVAVVAVGDSKVIVRKLVMYDTGISLLPLNLACVPVFYTNDECETLPVCILGQAVELRGKL